MSIHVTRGHDSSFGPPSEPIPIRTFLNDTASLACPSPSDAWNHTGWQSLSQDEQVAVAAECSGSIAELKTAIEEVWDNPILSAHLYRSHAAAVNAIHGQAGGSAPKGRKRKRLPDPEEAAAQPDARALQEKLDTVSLQCWGLNQESAFFMRAPRHSDFNALKHTKGSGHGMLSPTPSSQLSACPRREALVTLTVYNRVPWIHSQLTRFSQHVVLSSQTLADFIQVIPCDSSEVPNEVVDDRGNVIGYASDNEDGTAARTERCLLLIDGAVYGDGQPGNDYADKLLSHLERLPEEKRPQITKSLTSLSETLFASLTLRINEPYWMLHQGSCEHFIVVDQIRLVHPTDPPSGYPHTTHVTPALGDVCKACAKVPAVLTIVGDIRLGESPCLLCAPCWRNMGPPGKEDAEQVMVVPFVRHRRVWEDTGV